MPERDWITPDHVIRTGPWPLIVPAPEAGRLDDFKNAVQRAARTFTDDYSAYFARQKTRAKGAAMRDPLPRVVLVPGVGLMGLGANAKEARIAADVAEAAAEGISGAEAIGKFKSISEADMFDVEYWPLELAKLGQRKRLPLEGQVAAITEPAESSARQQRKPSQMPARKWPCSTSMRKPPKPRPRRPAEARLLSARDVTSVASVRTASRSRRCSIRRRRYRRAWNAGAAWQGKIGEVDEAVLRESFELNFFAHQKVAQAAVNIMLKQGIGGCLLFNTSKQAVNPGPEFGPYGLPKAATLLLMRQYALDYGADGIRSNAVNADRIRSGLLTADDRAARQGPWGQRKGIHGRQSAAA